SDRQLRRPVVHHARMKRLFRNPKPALYAILLFVACLLLLFAISSRAAEQTLTLEAGSAIVRGETPTIGRNSACLRCGPIDTDYEFGFDLIGESTYHGENPNAIQVHAQLVDGWKRAELGLGFYYQNSPGAYVCDFGFHLLARYRFTDRIAAQWRHSS